MTTQDASNTGPADDAAAGAAAGDSADGLGGRRPEEVVARVLAEARRLEEIGQPSQAEALLDEAPAVLHRFGSFHYAHGALAFRRGDLDAAIARFARAVEEDSEVAEYYGNLGAATLERGRRLGRAGDIQRAAATLEHAAELRPRLAFVHANHGLALSLLNRHAEALEAYARALELDDEDAAALYNLAASQHALGDEGAALATLDRLLTLQPTLVPALRSRVATLARLGRADDAREALAVYLAEAPEAADGDELRALIG